jgi:hypothetical protein
MLRDSALASEVSMRRAIQVFALAGLMMAGAVWLGGIPAGAAAAQVSHTNVDVSLTGIDVCGFTVDSVVRGTDTFQVSFDRSGNVSMIQDMSHVVSTITNEANGKLVYVENAGRDNLPLPVANADGTFTTTDTLTGMPVRIYTSHSSTFAQRGYLSFVDTFDADGNFLSGQVIVHGPHPPGDAPFCDAITSALG